MELDDPSFKKISQKYVSLINIEVRIHFFKEKKKIHCLQNNPFSKILLKIITTEYISRIQKNMS